VFSKQKALTIEPQAGLSALSPVSTLSLDQEHKDITRSATLAPADALLSTQMLLATPTAFSATDNASSSWSLDLLDCKDQSFRHADDSPANSNHQRLCGNCGRPYALCVYRQLEH